MNPSKLKSSWEALVAHKSFILACHVQPDGDCLGAALALARTLRSLGKDATVISQDPVPDHYRFLPESDTIVHTSDRRDFEVGVVVDCDQPSRTGTAAELINSAKITARIDHHLTKENFGDIQIYEPNISSTSELIVELFDAVGIEIDQATATMLMTGIVFDTGGFRYSNATSRTFEIASRFAAMGVSPSEIVRSVFESRPLRAAKLLGRALSSMQETQDGKIVWAELSSRDYIDLDADDSCTEGIVNTVAAIKGPRVVMLLREIEPGIVRASLRSRDGFDVNKVAAAFGGGGHAAASGCTIEDTLQQARNKLISEVRRWMES